MNRFRRKLVGFEKEYNNSTYKHLRQCPQNSIHSCVWHWHLKTFKKTVEHVRSQMCELTLGDNRKTTESEK